MGISKVYVKTKDNQVYFGFYQTTDDSLLPILVNSEEKFNEFLKKYYKAKKNKNNDISFMKNPSFDENTTIEDAEAYCEEGFYWTISISKKHTYIIDGLKPSAPTGTLGESEFQDSNSKDFFVFGEPSWFKNISCE